MVNGVDPGAHDVAGGHVRALDGGAAGEDVWPEDSWRGRWVN